MPNAKSTATRVLIIDDDPLIRALLVSTLRKDCRVAVAADGAAGFRKAMEVVPDVAVIDVNMPGWDGLKTLEAFRAHPKLRDVKILMLTADSSKQTVMAAIRGGANDYLIKTTFSKADFHKKLNRLIPGTIAGPPGHSAIQLPDGATLASTRQDAGANGVPAAALALAAPAESPHRSQLQVMIDGWE